MGVTGPNQEKSKGVSFERQIMKILQEKSIMPQKKRLYIIGFLAQEMFEKIISAKPWYIMYLVPV